MQFDLWIIVPFALISGAAAFGALALARAILPGKGANGSRRVLPVTFDVTRDYRFREGYLLSQIDPNDAFLDPDVDRSNAFATLRATLADLDPAAPKTLDALQARGEAFVMTFQFGPDPMTLSGYWDDEEMVITIAATQGTGDRETVDTAVLRSLTSEAEELRATLDQMPLVVWKQARDGRIQWANGAYYAWLDASDDQQADGDTTSGWPVPKLFDLNIEQIDLSDAPSRHSLRSGQGDVAATFEISAHRNEDGTVMCIAAQIDRLIAAESSLKSFVQTLSKSFAALPIGLAIFDRDRHLVMFNPALSTLSTLGIEFLSNRPTIRAFFDSLRAANRVPEPKNYRDWRDQIARMEAGAEAGDYQELWSLPDGQTLRVIGRPHPDGAVAFMFEDITAEMTLTRQFRGTMDIYGAVLDDLPSALAAFHRDGRLAVCNAAFRDLWQVADAPETLKSATEQFQNRSDQTTLWGEIETFVTEPGDRKTQLETVRMTDGRLVSCRISALPGGASLLQFDPTVGTEAGAAHGDFATRDAPASSSYEAAEAGREFVHKPRKPNGKQQDDA